MFFCYITFYAESMCVASNGECYLCVGYYNSGFEAHVGATFLKSVVVANLHVVAHACELVFCSPCSILYNLEVCPQFVVVKCVHTCTLIVEQGLLCVEIPTVGCARHIVWNVVGK